MEPVISRPYKTDYPRQEFLHELAQKSPSHALQLLADIGYSDEEIELRFGIDLVEARKRQDTSPARQAMSMNMEDRRKYIAESTLRRCHFRIRLLMEDLMKHPELTLEVMKELRELEKHIVLILRELGELPQQSKKLEITQKTMILEAAVSEIRDFREKGSRLFEKEEELSLPPAPRLEEENEEIEAYSELEGDE